MSLAAGIAAVAAVAVIAVIALSGAGGREQTRAFHVRFGGHVLVVRDLLTVQKAAPVIAGSHIVTRALRLKTANHASIAFGGGSAWVLSPTGAQATSPCGKLLRVNASSVTVTGSVPIRLCPAAVAYGDGAVWVLSFQIGVRGFQLTRINPGTLALTSVTTIDAGAHRITPAGDTGAKYMFVAAANGKVFVVVQDRSGGAQLTVLDAASGHPWHQAVIPAGDGPVTALGSNGSAVWAGTANGWVFALDPVTGTVRAARQAGTRVVSMSVSATAVWVSVNLPVPARAAYPGLAILRLDPVTGKLTKDTGLPMAYVAAEGPSLWALSSAPPDTSASGLVAEINPANGAITRRASLPAPGYQMPDTIGVYQRHAWVINDFLGTLTRIAP
jgi:outer membrane protein assembly factor BamB